MVNKGWIHVRDSQFLKFHDRKIMRGCESFGKWHHNLLVMSDAPNGDNFFSPFTLCQPSCNGMSLDSWFSENIDKWCYGTGRNNQYRNLQTEVDFEMTRFHIARDQHHHWKCAG